MKERASSAHLVSLKYIGLTLSSRKLKDTLESGITAFDAMENIMRYLICLCICICYMNVLTRAASLPYNIDLDQLGQGDINEVLRTMSDAPVKRGLCRDGFTYQAILRDCVPSLGALRGRGRYGGRGRRGSPWAWRV